jgi:uncharacterized membrane protein YozB (DUF420 family)
MSVRDLPAINASLNALSAAFLLAGWLFIRAGRRRAHARCMLSAVASSAAFLACYVAYHLQVGSVPYQGTGALRVIYFVVLISHVLLAMAVPPLAALTLWPAVRERFDRHRRIARWTLPIWGYVSVTGVVIYAMLYGL